MIEGYKLSVIGWNGEFSISIGALFTTTGPVALRESVDVDEVLGVEVEKDKVSARGLIDGLPVYIGDIVTNSSSSYLLSTGIRSELEVAVKSTVICFWKKLLPSSCCPCSSCDL